MKISTEVSEKNGVKCFLHLIAICSGAVETSLYGRDFGKRIVSHNPGLNFVTCCQCCYTVSLYSIHFLKAIDRNNRTNGLYHNRRALLGLWFLAARTEHGFRSTPCKGEIFTPTLLVIDVECT